MSKISELSDGGSLVSSDYLIAVRSGGNVKVRMDQINVDQVDLGDNEFIRLGNSQDLTMVHTSTQSIINQAGIGDLLIQKAGATKLTINATGIDVTGNVTASRLITTDGIQDAGSGGSESVFNNGQTTANFRVATTGNANTLFVDGGSNNVGIGTSSPATELHVASPSDSNAQIRINGNTSTVYSRLYSDNNGVLAISTDVGNQVAGSYMMFEVKGSEAMRIDASGNVGIGTSSPSQKLHVDSGTTDTVALFESSGDANAYLVVKDSGSSGGAFFGANGTSTIIGTGGSTERMRIDSSGNVGIGTSSPRNDANFKTLQIGDSSAAASQLVLDDNDSSGPWRIISNLSLIINDDADERMRIDSSGNLLVGTASSDAKLHVGSDLTSLQAFRAFGTTAGDTSLTCGQFAKYDNNTTTSQIFVNFTVNNGGIAQGQINANGASQAAFGAWSDRRLKHNIENLPSQLANITALRPVEFDYIESEGGGHQLGFIAQEVEEIYPDLVGERPDGMKTLSSLGKWEARLVKAIQEQQATIEALTARIAALES